MFETGGCASLLIQIAELNAIIQDYQGEPGLLPSKL